MPMPYNQPDLPMLADLYAELLETQPSVSRWMPSQEGDGWVDRNNDNRLIDEGKLGFRVSRRSQGRHHGTHFVTAPGAMAAVDVAYKTCRRFVLYEVDSIPGQGFIVATGVMFWGGVCALLREEGDTEVEVHKSMKDWLDTLPENVRAAWIDPE